MKHYGIEMEGKFYIEQLSSVPGWSASDEGRIIYDSTSNILFIGTNTSWSEITLFAQSTTMLFGNASAPAGWTLLSGWSDNRILISSSISEQVSGTFDPTSPWIPSIDNNTHSHPAGTLSFAIGAALYWATTNYNYVRFSADGINITINYREFRGVNADVLDDEETKDVMGGIMSASPDFPGVWAYLRTIDNTGSGNTSSTIHGHTTSNQYQPQYKTTIACEKD